MTPEPSARLLVLAADDSVAIALGDLAAGDQIDLNGGVLEVLQAVPKGHKVALRDVAQGDPVYKYATQIGAATTPIQAGTHVHVHNVESERMRGDKH